jgi:hypothetical protein
MVQELARINKARSTNSCSDDRPVPTGNIKRAFNRLFIVATIAWALYCFVIWSIQQEDDVFAQAQTTY